MSKEQGVASGLPIPLGKQSAKARCSAEAVSRQGFLADADIVELVLEICEFTDHGAQRRDVSDGCRANAEHR
jgi:hypothetical protein